MRKAILIMLFCSMLIGLNANKLDDAMEALFNRCSVTNYLGNKFLITSSPMDSPEAALQFLAWSASVILPVVEEWIPVGSSYSYRLSTIVAVGASWSTKYGDFVVFTSISEIRSQFGNSNCDDFNQMMADIQAYLEKHAQIGLMP